MAICSEAREAEEAQEAAVKVQAERIKWEATQVAGLLLRDLLI